ncbi:MULTISPECIES: hypothetical protein [unclassified Sphingomonas]|uniref:hypothetical protein n=1 Tax=unclassified Sphingomonas TaxID=196159 RepID=UPI000B2D5A1B|nr:MULTISPECIES: hypothetical protein [unclassified Sphingomonas]
MAPLIDFKPAARAGDGHATGSDLPGYRYARTQCGGGRLGFLLPERDIADDGIFGGLRQRRGRDAQQVEVIGEPYRELDLAERIPSTLGGCGPFMKRVPRVMTGMVARGWTVSG